jgi:hypothetical protein
VSDQIEEKEPKKSRRALLAAAVGGAAAVAAQAALPLAAQAHDADDVQKGVSNTTTATTEIDSSATVDVDAFAATASGTGSAVVATAADGPALEGANDNSTTSGAYVTSGDATNAVPVDETGATGLYSWTPTAPDPDTMVGIGVWGDSEDIGSYGSGGFVGVEGDAFAPGGTGVVGYADQTGGTGVLGFANDTSSTGVLGIAAQAGGVGVEAYAPDTDQVALKVTGKVQFSRAGRNTISAGHSSITVAKAGVSSSSRIFAVIASNRSGRWVRAVVPTTNAFTIYLNTTVTAATYVSWWIIN